jgi:hypothetical protein
MAPAQCVSFAPYLTPMSDHQEQHCRSLSVASLVMDFLLQQWALVAYLQLFAASQLYSLPSVDQTW